MPILPPPAAPVPVASIIPGPKFTITPKSTSDANGLFLLGNTDPDNALVGGYVIDFRMDQLWSGTIALTGRSGVHRAGFDDIAGLGNWPFRAFYLNGVPWDGSMLSGSAALITATSAIIVPAPGITIGMVVGCSAGSCQMYYVPVTGAQAM
jgi:hypothetical protein